MTTTVTKVQTKWEAKKTQDTTAILFSHLYLAAFEAVSRAGDKVREEFETVLRQHKIEHFKALGIKTPIELVQAIADQDHNLFGSDIEISGDDSKATLKYNSCGMWNATKKEGKVTEEQQKKMGENCVASWTKIASELGFKYEPKMDKDTFEMTFSK